LAVAITHLNIDFKSRLLADCTNGRTIGTVLRPSVCLSLSVCDVMYCG